MSTDNEVVKNYPTTPDAEGWYTVDEGEEALEIETREDDDECVYKRVKLSKGRTAVVRELGGKEMKQAQTMVGKDPQKLVDAYVFLSTTITDKDGKKYPFVMEDLEDVRKFKGKDYNRLTTAAAMINF